MNAANHWINRETGITAGHGRKDNEMRNKFFEEHPIASAIGVVAVTPLSEELIARKLPHSLAEKYPKYARSIELGAVALFALGHTGKDGIPFSQTIGGLLYSELYKTGGLKASYAAHAANNATGVLNHIRTKRKNSRES